MRIRLYFAFETVLLVAVGNATLCFLSTFFFTDFVSAEVGNDNKSAAGFRASYGVSVRGFQSPQCCFPVGIVLVINRFVWPY